MSEDNKTPTGFVTGLDVWEWPELKALFERLGVDINKYRTRHINIDIPYDGLIEVTQLYIAPGVEENVPSEVQEGQPEETPKASETKS